MRRVLVGAGVVAFVLLIALPASAQDRDCGDFAFQEDAQAYFDARGGSPSNNVDNLDADHDGIACELRPSLRGGTVPSSTARSGSPSRLPTTGVSPLAFALGGIALIQLGGVLILTKRRLSGRY